MVSVPFRLSDSGHRSGLRGVKMMSKVALGTLLKHSQPPYPHLYNGFNPHL